jgi:PKD repeat protein
LDKIDKNISDLLNDKLNQHESAFSDSLWGNIASQLPATSAPAAGSSFFKTLFGKAIIGATAAAVISAGVFFTVSEEKPAIVESAPLKEQNDTKAPDSKPTEEPTQTDPSTPNTTSSSVNKTTSPNNSNDAQERIIPDLSATPRISESSEDHRANQHRPASQPEPLPSKPSEHNRYPLGDPITPIKLDAQFQSKTVDQNALRYFFFASTDQAKSFEWSINGEAKSTDNNFSYQFAEEGVYEIQLTVFGINNQTATSTSTIKAFKPVKFEIPNAFSPGNDGKNDFIDFTEKTKNESQMISLTIVDTNGNRIFESKELFIWNGETMQGDKAAPGAYQYILSVKDHFDQIQSKSGIIQLFAE